MKTLKTLLRAALPALALPVLALAQTASPNYNIATVAGSGTAGFEGDGAAAKSAKLNSPIGVWRDANGNLVICDQVNHRLRKIDTSGNISTIAGLDVAGYNSDQKTADKANLNAPTFIVMDSSGIMYFSDTANSVVRKIDASNNITRFAGVNAIFGYAGDDTETTASDATLALAQDAYLNTPLGLALDSKNGVMYIADSKNHVIRKVVLSTSKITTFAGTGTAGVLGDGGLATSAFLNHPVGIALDSAGALYIADQMNHRIRKVSTDGKISTVAGNGLPGYSGNGGKAVNARLYYPTGISVDASGNIFIADYTNNRIRMVMEDGTINTIAGTGVFGDTGEGGLATKARLRFPTNVLAASNGTVYVVDTQNQKIKLLTKQAVTPTSVPGIRDGGVITAADYGASTSVAPGAWVEISGDNLAATTRDWTDADFQNGQAPLALDGTTVTAGGQNAVVAAISPSKLRVQLPYSLGLGPQDFQVTTAQGASSAYRVTVDRVVPGVYAPQRFVLDGRQYAAAVIGDEEVYALPEGAVEGVTSRPVRRGETLTLLGTGFGQVTPSVNAGDTAREASSVNLPVDVRIGETSVPLAYAGLAPGKVGLYQLRFVVPETAAAGTVRLMINVDGVENAQTLYLAIQE